MTKALIHNLGSSLSFGRLPLKAKVLWPMLLAASDDQGRGIAEADAVKWYLCPNVQEIAVDEVFDLLLEMVKQGMIVIYNVSPECKVYQVIRWWEYQQLRWARPSRFEPPEGWTDRIRYSNRGDMHTNEGWSTTGGFDAMARDDAKVISGQAPDHDPPVNCTENPIENNADFQPNLTQPNLTQPNPTHALLAEDAPSAPEPQTITPGPEPPKLPPTLTKQEIAAYLEHPDPVLQEKWPEIMAEVAGQVTQGTYNQMISPLRPLTIRDGIAVLCHPTAPGADWCRIKLKRIMPRTVGGILHQPVRIAFTVGGPP